MKSRRPPHRYVLFNKPYGVLCAFTDSLHRQTLGHYIPIPDVYPAGRLDFDSEGLVLLTTDGRLAHWVTNPGGPCWKSYLVQVEGIPEPAAVEALRQGVVIRGRRSRPAVVTLLNAEPNLWPRPVPIRFRKHVPTAWVGLKIREGRNRQVRKMTAAVGHPTLRLIRIGIGPLSLKGLKPGEWRRVSDQEVLKLRQSCGT